MNPWIKEQMKESIFIYKQRMAGDDSQWSATTKCVKCDELWLYGVKDNLDFTCPKCTTV